MKTKLSGLALMALASAMLESVYRDPYASKKTITTPASPVHSNYSLPKWKVGKHYIYAKNPKDALKYAKKRGLWDGKSYPMTIV